MLLMSSLRGLFLLIFGKRNIHVLGTDCDSTLDKRIVGRGGQPRRLGRVKATDGEMRIEDNGMGELSRRARSDTDEAQIDKRFHALLPGAHRPLAGVGAVLVQRGEATVGVIVTFVGQFFGMVVLAVVAWVSGVHAPAASDWVWSALAGVLGSTGLLAFIGAISLIRAFVQKGEPIPAYAWKPLLWITGSPGHCARQRSTSVFDETLLWSRPRPRLRRRGRLHPPLAERRPQAPC
mgnify:CR=1 FL=1